METTLAGRVCYDSFFLMNDPARTIIDSFFLIINCKLAK
jgi:hypothetical protein